MVSQTLLLVEGIETFWGGDSMLKAAIYDVADTFFHPKCIFIIMFVYNQNPWNVETLIFRKADRFPMQSQQYLNCTKLFDSLDACLLLSKNCAPHSVNSKAGHYINIVAHRTSLFQPCTATKMRPRCAYQPEYTIPCPPEVYQNPLK